MTAHDGGLTVIDEHGNALCGRCVDGILFAPAGGGQGYQVGMRSGDAREYVWAPGAAPSPEVVDRFRAYLANPACSLETHRVFEDSVRERALAEAKAALSRLDEIDRREPGWSM